MGGVTHTLISGGNMATPHQWNHVLNQNPALLLHFDGADTAQFTTDSGLTNHTINFNETAQLDTDESKFFGSSLLLDGDSDYLDIDDHADWDIVVSLTDSWTIDLCVKHTDHVGVESYINQYEDSNNYWHLYHQNAIGLRFKINKSGTSFSVHYEGSDEITDTNWHHIALCKVANYYGIYLDGNLVYCMSDDDIDTFAGSLYIGALGAGVSDFFQGHMDEIRLVHGNPFGASPSSGEGNKITVPSLPYTSWR